MFGRRTTKNSEPQTTAESPPKSQGKGRPTPKRSEAEKARKKRAKPPRDRKEAARLQRERMRAEREKRVKGMQTGDERYLPARDRGPVRHFVRDFVDSRRSAAEFVLPVLVVVLLLSFVRTAWAANAVSLVFLTLILLTTVDTVFLLWRLTRQLKVRFPDTATKGAKFYAFLRSTQMRFSRMPKAQVKPGESLPDHY